MRRTPFSKHSVQRSGPCCALLTILFGALTAAAFQAQSPLTGPVEGFTYDAPTRSIRSVIGSLGSASLGPAVVRDVDFASVAPGRNYAVAFRGWRGLAISELGSGQPSAVDLPRSLAVPEGVVWSSDGSAAIFYRQTQNRLRIVTGFPASVQLGPEINLSLLGGTLSAAAISPDGRRVVAGVTGDHAGVYEIADGQSFIPLLDIAKPVALAFSGDGERVYALNGATGEISEFDRATSSSQTWPSALKDPVAILVTRDAANRQIVYVAGRADRALVAYDGSSHEAVANLPLTFPPALIEPLGLNSFRLTARVNGSDLLWSFTNGQKPAVYFVPATPLASRRERRLEVRGR